MAWCPCIPPTEKRIVELRTSVLQWSNGKLWKLVGGGTKHKKVVSTVTKERWVVGIYCGWLLTGQQELSGGGGWPAAMVKANMVTSVVVAGHSDMKTIQWMSKGGGCRMWIISYNILPWWYYCTRSMYSMTMLWVVVESIVYHWFRYGLLTNIFEPGAVGV